MPHGRVLSTPEAKQSVTRMQTIINQGLLDQINLLDREGSTLSDPNVWDGDLAAVFRSDWPGTSSTLKRIQQDLETLRSRVQQINGDIMVAGGNAA
jgi:uncharacterized protein YukE